MINGKTVTIKQITPIIQDYMSGILPKKGEEHYKKSKKFYKKNGFHYESTWDLDSSIAAFILPRLIYFRDHHHGVPNSYCKFADDGITILNLEEAEQEWFNNISYMIEAFYCVLSFDEKVVEKWNEFIKRGLQLFCDNFSNLWD